MLRSATVMGILAGIAGLAMHGCTDRDGLQRRGTEVQIGSRYRPCSGDTDCVLVETGCDGCCQQDAIAEELREAYRMAFVEECADYEGAICDCDYTPLEPRCVDAQCAAVPPEPEDASRPDPDPYALTREGMNVVIGEAYLACAQDADCTLVGISCSCCDRGAINSSLVETYMTNVRLACMDYQGPVCDCEEVPAEARCVADRCQINLL
jgi:hypothetical protein